jgi:hypothetical protein
MATGATNTKHDVKVYSILADHAYSSTATRGPSANLDGRAKVLAQTNRYLANVAEKARRNAPLALGRFGALVFSTGGLIEADTQKQLASWKEAIGDSTWNWTLRRISLSLVRARARTFSM